MDANQRVDGSAAGGVLAILLRFRSLLAGPNVADAGSMPANLEAAQDFLTRPAAYERKNAQLAMLMPRHDQAPHV